MTTLTSEGEVLVALCEECKCCLANSAHCWICHTNTTIRAICGCGECPERADAFLELVATRRKANIPYARLKS